MNAALSLQSPRIITANKIIDEQPDIKASELAQRLGHHVGTVLKWHYSGLISLSNIKTRVARFCHATQKRRKLKTRIEILKYAEAPWASLEFAGKLKWAWRVTASNGVECSGAVAGTKRDAAQSARSMAERMHNHYERGDAASFIINSASGE